jgi:hypothetical protein
MSEYLGEDLILATGAPGSGWSGGLRTLSFASEVNNSDVNPGNIYFGPGQKGHHYGAYFGPGEKYGGNFATLSELTREEILAEFKKPFTRFDGIRSSVHQFAYHLDYLASLFPKARFACFFRETDDLTFDWWHKCGGWSISHPKYEWYENDERMKRQISIENKATRKFATERGMRVFNGVFDTSTIFSSLGLTFTRDSIKEVPVGSQPLFAKLNSEERYYKVRFGTTLNNDPYMFAAIL